QRPGRYLQQCSLRCFI
ncbi:ankyrin repeat-containing domain protein, partial [Neofusicoccum parvum]